MADTTIYIDADNSSTVYAKPITTLIIGDWNADTIEGSAIGVLDTHSIVVDDLLSYFIYIQSGVDPANTDTKIANVYADTSTPEIIEAIEDINLTPIIDAINLLSARISSSVIETVSPLASDGTSLTLIQGDDYLEIDSRNITFTGDMEDQWPDLTGATLVFGINNTNILKEVSVVTPVGTQQLSLELTKEETSIPQGSYKYDVQATLSNGSVVTLFRGSLEIIKSYT